VEEDEEKPPGLIGLGVFHSENKGFTSAGEEGEGGRDEREPRFLSD